PEGAARLEDAHHRRAPAPGPGQVRFRTLAIVVDVVAVADVEGRVREGQIDRPRLHGLQARQAITAVELVEFHAGGCGHASGTCFGCVRRGLGANLLFKVICTTVTRAATRKPGLDRRSLLMSRSCILLLLACLLPFLTSALPGQPPAAA